MICVIGAGYVGLVASACFADTGLRVTLFDTDEKRIRALRAGRLPIYEPGLAEMFERNLCEGRLRPTASAKKALSGAKWALLTVGTPPLSNGEPDLCQVEEAVHTVGAYGREGVVLVIKSTVPVGTADRLRGLLEGIGRSDIAIVSNPEFLRQGQAVTHFMHPDRLVVGCREKKAGEAVVALHEPYLKEDTPVFITDNRSAEMTKYAANAFLATRISFINEIANLCGLVGADIEVVRQAIGADNRIGSRYLHPGVGYGGSCLSKDLRALIVLGDAANYEPQVLKGAHEVNERQKQILAEMIWEYFGGELAGRKIAVWGLSFKAETDDVRDSPALRLIESLLTAGCQIQVFDPAAIHRLEECRDQSVAGCTSLYDAVTNADALAVMTEWQEFRAPDWARVRRLMKTPLVFDGRNLYQPDELARAGFMCFGIGRPPAFPEHVAGNPKPREKPVCGNTRSTPS